MKNTEIIKKNYEFKYFFKKGQFFSGNYLELFIFDSNTNKNKLGIAVSKKIGKSVERNQAKRYIREAYYLVEENLKVNINLIITCKKNIDVNSVTFFDIKNDLEKILKKAGKIKEI